MEDDDLKALRAKRMAELQGQGVRIQFLFGLFCSKTENLIDVNESSH